MEIVKVLFRNIIWALLVLALLHSPQAMAENNGLARTPPMGWNSWNHFGCGGLNETVIHQMADAMVSTGMAAAGYQYINLDDCWQNSRAGDGTIVADKTKFPSGIPALANYVHSKGLKLGLYTDAGTGTCQKRPGSFGHYQQDANTYASWGVDYIKVDWCNTSGLTQQTQYTQFSQALLAATPPHPIVFSLCEWGGASVWNWAPAIGNLWRTTGDINDSWARMTRNMDSSGAHYSAAGPGGWNDPDMLEAGNGGMSATEDQTHFSMWAMMAAPLITGNNLATMSATTIGILTNSEVLAIDQDPLGHQAIPGAIGGDGSQMWYRTLSAPTGQTARGVALLNRSTATIPTFTVTWSQIGLPAGPATVRDVVNHVDLGTFTGSYTAANVPSHAAVVLKIVSGATPAPAVSITPSSHSLTVGATASYTVTVNGFSAAASLTVAGLPAGSSAYFTPASVADGTPSTLNVATSASDAPGTYALTVTGTSGSQTAQAAAQLVLTPAQDFSLTGPAGAPNIEQGASATYAIGVVAQNGFSGIVSLAASGLPANATASFSPGSVTGSSSSTLTIATTAFTTPTGTYTVTVTGTSGGLSHTVTVILIVIPSPSGCFSAAAGKGWTHTPFAPQTGTFTATWDAMPSAATTNDVMGLSNGPQTANTGFAVIVSFSNTGHILARNGGAYAATNLIAYQGGVEYRFRVVVNVPAHTYSVYVLPAGGTETAIATNFAFRTEQAHVTVLNSVGSNADTAAGTFTYCNFAVN